MGEEKVVMKMGNNKRKKNRQVINVGGGNGNQIIGLVIFGGALAVAGFIAFINKNRTKTNPKPKPQQPPSLDNACKTTQEKEKEDHEIETTEGLRLLLQLSTNGGDASSNGTTDMKSINHTCVLEEKIEPVLEINNISEVVQEILLSDDSHPENETSSHDSETEEEFIQGSQTQEMQDVEPEEEKLDDGVVSEIKEEEEEEQDDDVVSEIKEEEKQDDGVVSEIEEEEEEKQDDGVVSEIEEEEEEESSKEIMNYNEKPDVWSAEDDFDYKGEGVNFEIQNEEAKTDSDATNEDMAITPEITLNGKGNPSVDAVNDHQPSTAVPHSFQLTMLLPGLLLLPILLFLIYYTQNIFVL